ncbi:MAG: aspartyl/asparaginyl beta-hydroxylase domain-containing protein [Gammaproteobacteria bacterium]
MPNSTPEAANQIAMLADSATALAHRGDKTAAETIYRKLLDAAPYHLQALMFLAMRAFERGDAAQSQELLKRAVQVDPKRAMLYQNLGIVYRAQGLAEQALEAFNRAIALQPGYVVALLHQGALLDKLGREPEALASYRQALACMQPPAAETLRDSSTPAPIREMLTHAVDFVREHINAITAQHLEPVTQRHGDAALVNIQAAASLLAGGPGAPGYAHALQRPAYLYVPGIEPRPFFERTQFAWAPALEACTAAILAEAEAVLASEAGLEPYVDIDVRTDPQQWRELNHSSQWNSFHLLRGGKIQNDNAARCPATMQALGQLPLPQIPGHTPEAFFSILRPGTHIPSHYGLGNYKLVVHLPLVVPQDCAIRVGHETRGWSAGQCLIFDDSFQHEAWNRSQERRVVLITEIWNPLLSAAECDGVTALVAALAAINRGTPSGHGA